MKKISGSTFFFKKLFPCVWFGFITIFFVTSLKSGAADSSSMFLVTPPFLVIFGIVLFKNVVWDLSDEVFDGGDFLLFKKGGKQQRVYLKDIVNINYTQMSSPERIQVSVRVSGAIGRELVFNPPLRLFRFTRNKIVTELIQRVDRERNT